MQDDRTLQPLEDARTRAISRSETLRLLARTTAGRRPPGLVRDTISNGYTNADGDFVLYAAYDSGGGYDADGMR